MAARSTGRTVADWAATPEDVNAFSTDPSGTTLYLSTIAQLVVNENVKRLVAQDDDIVSCKADPGPPLACSSWGLLLDGASIGLGAYDVKGLEVHSAFLP